MKYEGNVLEVEDLVVSFETSRGRLRAVDGASFYLHEGKVLGIVGESGSGKSVTSLALMGLLPDSARVDSGRVRFFDQDLLTMKPKERRELMGGDISMIFQDPMTALNPSFTIEFQLSECFRSSQKMTRNQRHEKCLELLNQVGIPDPSARLKSYPHELSGGMAQRVMIAMAIASEPKLLIADEPTTALDVTIQAQILKLLKKLQEEMGMAMILISHDLGVVANYSDHILVMYAGQVMEIAETDELIYNPSHPYTVGLLRSMPGFDEDVEFRSLLPSISGVVPDLLQRPSGCQFHPRCDHFRDHCKAVLPPLIERKLRRIKCHYPIESD